MVNNIFFLICCIGADDVGGDGSGGGVSFGDVAKKHGEFNQIQPLIIVNLLVFLSLRNMICDRCRK